MGTLNAKAMRCSPWAGSPRAIRDCSTKPSKRCARRSRATKSGTAAALYERALAILDRNFGTNYPDAAGALTHLAGLRIDAGRLDEAKQLLDRAQYVTEQEFGINHPDLAVVLNGLGYWHAHSGQIALAVQTWQHSLEITKASLGPNHPDVVDCLDFWEEGLREANQPEEADRI